MQKLPSPNWDQRTLPNLQVTDVYDGSSHQDHIDATTERQNEQHEIFISWLNRQREPLQQALRNQPPVATRALADRGLHLGSLRSAVAVATGTLKYPARRVLTGDQAAELVEYDDAIEAVTPGMRIREDDHYIFNPVLGAIVLSDKFISEASPYAVADAVTSALGQAATAAIVDVQVQYDPPAFRYWYGYQWHYDGDYYGWTFQRALTTKIAALARRHLGLSTPGEPVDHLALEQYRMPEGFFPETGTAVAMDLLDQASLIRGGGSLYELLWNFARQGRPQPVRADLAEKVSKLTKGRLQIDELELIKPEREGLNLELVEAVEDVLQLPDEMRPSHLLRSEATNECSVQQQPYCKILTRRYTRIYDQNTCPVKLQAYSARA